MPPNARTSRDQLGLNPGRRSRPDTLDTPDQFEWIIYVRISDDREGSGLGVARQEKECRDLHERAKLDGNITTVLVDNDMTAHDKSGRYKPRPDYDRLCELLAERPGRRGVLTWHSDRLHRTPAELEQFINLVESTAAPVQTVKAGILDLSTASGRMTARVHCAVARHESELKSERIQSKVRQLAESGAVYGGGPRPYGYNRIYDREGPRRKILRDEINHDEAAVVRECARRILSGDTLRSVVRWMNLAGIKTSTGRPWSQQALRIMMTSGRIAGLREHHGEVVAKAVWPGIITVEQHERLRAILAGNERAPGSRVRKHFLSGFVYCSACVEQGVKMRVCPQHGKLKYKCLSDTGGCNGRVISLADLEKWIGGIIVTKMLDPRALTELASRHEDRTVEAAALVERIEAAESRLAKLKAALDDDDEDDLPEVVSSIRKLRKQIEGMRGELGRVSSVPGIPRESFRDLAERWGDLDLDQKRALVGMFIDRILIHPAVRGRSRFDPDRVQVIPAGGREDGQRVRDTVAGGGSRVQ